MKLLYFITGGRPMKFVEYCLWDGVAGKPVHLYEDKFGRRWMAFGRWSWFRVPEVRKPT